MNGTLLLRLQGPMQAWGSRSNNNHRDTELAPTKSAVIGLIAAALGRDRATDISDLASLRYGVRIDAPGVTLRDYHTVQNVLPRDLTEHKSTITERMYRTDATYLVALEGPRTLLLTIQEALRSPHWPLSLGRRACPPSAPIIIHDNEFQAPSFNIRSILDALSVFPPLTRTNGRPLQVLLEANPTEEYDTVIRDQPTGPIINRTFQPRFVQTHWVKPQPPRNQP